MEERITGLFKDFKVIRFLLIFLSSYVKVESHPFQSISIDLTCYYDRYHGGGDTQNAEQYHQKRENREMNLRDHSLIEGEADGKD